MKHFARLTALVLLAAILLSLCGCSGFGQEKTDQQEREALQRMLEELSANIHPGTSGSSLTSARITAELIGWASTTKMDKKEAAQIVLEWVQEQSPELQAAFREKLESIGSTYGSILKDGAKDMMESAGINSDFSNLGSRIQELMAAILASGGID